MFYYFRDDPLWPLSGIASTLEELNRIIAGQKQTFPDFPVYWHEVNEGVPNIDPEIVLLDEESLTKGV